MNILALDLGTKTGWASITDGVIKSGTWVLASAKDIRENRKNGQDRRGDRRYFSLCQRLRSIVDSSPPFDIVAFEDVKFSVHTAQTQLWSSLRTAVWTVFDVAMMPDQQPRILPVPVPTLKKFATGHGGATKLMMAAWLARNHPELVQKVDIVRGTKYLETHGGRPVDDNETDAIHLLFYALAHANDQTKSGPARSPARDEHPSRRAT